MRGLKQCGPLVSYEQWDVASFTDAWIETFSLAIFNTAYPSHLLQMRGLKRGLSKSDVGTFESHLLQMRGLKLENEYKQIQYRQSHLLQMRGLKQIM